MNYTKIQKFLSYLLIFSILVSFTIRTPFIGLEKVFAADKKFFNVVSIIIEEEVYNKIEDEVKRYANDIQNVLENTKVIILPTPKDTSYFKIASLNESLYFDWYKSVKDGISFESKLIWTVIIWDLELPLVFNDNNSSKTILPYVDFEDKEYIYNHKTKKYEKNQNNSDWLKAEIWHWVISPNLWDNEKNIQWFRDYFDKNHDFYQGTWNFDLSNWILNWNKNEWVSNNYDPFVFYYDGFREQKALNPNNYSWYKWYIENKEDIVYNRFNKVLANKLKDEVLGQQTNDIWKLIEKVDPNIDLSAISSWMDLSNIPDIQTRRVVQQSIKNFIEAFSKWTIWEFRTNVHNAWRYNETWSKVNVDLIPFMVTVLDLVNDEVLKNINSDLEDQIDNLVANWLSRKIPLQLDKNLLKTTTIKRWGLWGIPISTSYKCRSKEKNYYYWKSVNDITSAKDCSIYLWSTYNWWTLVEANRWLNINIIQDDINKLRDESVSCLSWIQNWNSLRGYWWSNTPLNLDQEWSSNGELKLKSSNLKWSIVPIFDIVWSKKITDESKIPSPLDCLESNYLIVLHKTLDEDYECEVDLSLPVDWQSRVNWSCDSVNIVSSSKNNFNQLVTSDLNSNQCVVNYLRLDGVVINDISNNNRGFLGLWSWPDYDECPNWVQKNNYDYKSIPSIMQHKSPTSEELTAEINSMITPSLPIDRDRYVDFIDVSWNYAKINYPYLFRLELDKDSDFSIDNIEILLDEYLDKKSWEINEIILRNKSGANGKIYNLLKTWIYPESNFDLKLYLKNKPIKSLKIWSEEKIIDYYDMLVFAIYWNNLNNASTKYKFIFENYLSDEFWWNDNKFHLVKNKKQYEVAYLWANGDSENMYIKMDTDKWDNPYADILSNNISLTTKLMWSNIWWWWVKSEFKCAPPEWVPIWEWIPAIMCRLWDMLPPTISISEWKCGWENLFLSKEEKDEIKECNWDVNKDWINDCIVNKLTDGSIELFSDSDKYYYNKSWKLTARIKDKQWNIVNFDNSTSIKFELSKVVLSNNNEVVYDINDVNKRDFVIASKYVNLNKWRVTASAWEADYWFVTKNDNIDFYVKAYIKLKDNKNNEKIFIESNDLKIIVRWDRLFTSSYKFINNDSWLDVLIWENSIEANNNVNIYLVDKTKNNIDDIKNIISSSSIAKEKLVLLLENISSDWENINLSYPLNIKLYKDKEKIWNDIIINDSDLSSFKQLFSLSKSGTYNLEIIDNVWFKTTKIFEILPSEVDSVDLKLWTTVMKNWWNISTNLVTLLDKYWNSVSWKLYNIDLSINWDGVVFENNDQEELSLNTIEWFNIFRLRTLEEEWENEINIVIKDSSWEKLLNSIGIVRVIDEINFNSKLLIEDAWSGDIKVWANNYKFEITLTDSVWNILTDFNSRAYLWINYIYWEPTTSYVDLKNWKAIIEFKTWNISWQDIPIEFQIEWIWEIISENITILPEKPIKTELSLSQNKIEANIKKSSILKVELKDRYWNLVFNDNDTFINIDIVDKYSRIISLDNVVKKVSKWVSNFKIYWSQNPGVAYFRIWADPWFENNWFILSDANWEVEIKGVSENVWKIETFYFWNANKIKGRKYNALYTTLLWASYWDISKENYLAWSLLFEKDNRALSVTSLLNNPYKYNDIININPNWKVNFIYNSYDLSQDINALVSFDNNKLNLNLFNSSLNTLVWKILFNFGKNVELETCDWDILSCNLNDNKTSILLSNSSEDYIISDEDDLLIMKDRYWNNVLEIYDNWNIKKLWLIDFELKKEGVSNNLVLDIKTWSKIIWSLLINFVWAEIDISRDQVLFNNKVNSFKNKILVFLNTNSYGVHDVYNINNNSKVIYYNDPFASKNNLNIFSREYKDWYENFVKKWSLWWGWSNKTLLNFSSWKSVWESVKDYQSFSVINLWDPVISIKKIKKNLPKTSIKRNFDSTIWKLISNEDDIVAYQKIDFNNDKRDDILLIKSNNTFKLLENVKTSSNFIDMWNLAKVIDLWNKDLIKVWDFTWDNYWDIFFVNNDGKPFMLNNNLKDFSRFSLISQFNIDWKIIRAETYDMDNDWKSDIVTLDDNWEINIFYGWWTSLLPKFTRLNVSNSYWIKINNNIRNDNSLLYFDWLYSMKEEWDNGELLASNELYLDKLRENIKNQTQVNDLGNNIDDDFLDKIIFVEIPYKSGPLSTIKVEDVIINNINIPSSPETEKWLKNTKKTLTEFMQKNADSILYSDNIQGNKQTTFIKWEYSEVLWLKVEKVFTDINWSLLKSGDIIKIDITLINTWIERLENIAYIEKLENIFEIKNDSINIPSGLSLTKNFQWYDFLVDNFSLNPWESISINYSAEIRPIKYWYLKVGLYEEWELNDDIYGDIIFKENNENCSKTSEIFRSMWNRNYVKGEKTPTCNDDKIKLPENIEKNTYDADWNWIPDYIDNLTWNNEAMQEFAQESLKTLQVDSDNDWLPDSEDSFDSTIDIVSNLSEIDEKVSWIMDWIDVIIEWLWCWFGWGWCISTPLNWAPLAPWWDPTLFWFPIWDWLTVWEWIPVFSALTWIPTMCWLVPCCIPSVWPTSPLAFIPWPWVCWPMSAGWYLWTWSPFNFFRLSVTPTLTWSVWVSACFGWPAMVAWYAILPWLSPIVPWGNCVVGAMPLIWCSDDWSDWDVWSIWFSDVNWWNYDIINWNCSDWKNIKKVLNKQIVSDYMNYKKNPSDSGKFINKLKDFFGEWSSVDTSVDPTTVWPLISFNEWWEWQQLDIDIDTDALKHWDFQDVIKISNIRIPSFPEFLMEWATRQIEEFVNKLTDFPTVFIILPDFTWIFDWDWWNRSWNSWKYDEDIEAVDEQIDEYVTNKKLNKQAKKVSSWIKEAYEFIANIPFIKIKQETVDVSVPWPDQETLNKTLLDRENTIESWKKELKRAKDVWSFWNLCSEDTLEKQEKCEKENEFKLKIIVDTEALISSLEKNLEVINDYKDIPKKINKLVNKKQYYLEQILCNIDTVSFILWWRILKNWKRFKSWIELYVLIKAILKSWQVLIDLFIDYDVQCHECKNERFDLMTFIFKLISMIIPKIPVIQFPKWPDIIIDLHNIRAWLNIKLPDYNFSIRPIILPSLPELKLPDVPNLNIWISLPEIQILPKLVIPELPDLPILPTIELPDLPPPPTLPKLFASIEAVVNILKLVVKVMCILKSSPFVPEWRAWDLISYITERQWFLPLDFLFPSMPQFSYPFVDAIKVTTYVNFEFDSDFIVELAKQMVMPINAFPNDFSDIIEMKNLDFSDTIPNSIDVEIWSEWEEVEVSKSNFNKYALLLSIWIVKNIWKLVTHIENNKSDYVSNTEFKKLVNQSLSSKSITSDPKASELIKLWKDVNNMTFSKEDKIIKELKDNNKEKFDILRWILNTEIIKTKELKKNLPEILKPNLIKNVSRDLLDNRQLYNNSFKKYNDKFIDSAKKLQNLNRNIQKEELQEEGKKLISRIKTPLERYSNNLSEKLDNWIEENLLSSSHFWEGVSWWQNSCQAQANSTYKYNYKWLYVIENDTSYRLFDYLDELYWNEKVNLIDYDLDWDDDLLYIVNWELFIKENLKIKNEEVYVDVNPIVLDSDNNKFYNWDIFYESVNNVREVWSNNHYINMNFSTSTRDDINNYRIEFYRAIDRFLWWEALSDNSLLKSVIDWFAWINDITYISENNDYIERNNLAYINSVWDESDVKIILKELINIKQDLQNDIVVSLSESTKLYSWATPFLIKYKIDWEEKEQNLFVWWYKNIEIKKSIQVIWITRWDAFIEWDSFITVSWVDIRNYLWKPLFAWTEIIYEWDWLNLNEKSHIDIMFYDNTESMVDFRDIWYYNIYDLWLKSNDYSVLLNLENDYLYTRVLSFKKNIYSTYSNNVLLSPQVKADIYAPSLSFSNTIRIPVFQKKIIDLTPFIYEDNWVKNISEVYVDFDLEVDSNWDQDTKNDLDTDKIKIIKSPIKIEIEFWEFNELFKKNIWITLVDNNWNKSFTKIPFEVYSPKPKINSFEWWVINWNINENLNNEPVSIYRYRWGVIKKLIDIDWNNKTSTNDWNYSFSTDNNLINDWLILQTNNIDIAKINEKTWKIDLLTWLLNLLVLASNNKLNDTAFPKLIINDSNWLSIYEQYIKISNNNWINYVNNFSELNSEWIYVMFNNTELYSYYQIPEWVNYNPWAFVIYRLGDEKQRQLFTIFKDGRINTLNNNYKLEYSTFWDYIVIKLIDNNFNRYVAEILYKVEGNYIMN